MKKTFANLYLDDELISQLKESNLEVNMRVETMEYYMNRKGRHYFRSSFGKLWAEGEELEGFDLKIGQTYKLRFTK